MPHTTQTVTYPPNEPAVLSVAPPWSAAPASAMPKTHDAIAPPTVFTELVKPVATTPEERATAALDVAQAARRLATAVGAVPTDVLDADRPARSWADDWAVLADRLETWSASVAAGEDARFELPLTEDGWSVVTRMDLAASPDCPVPTSVVDLDTTPPPTPPLD